VAQPSGGSSLR